MHYLPYLTSAETEITIEKLDKVAKTLSEKVKAFAKFFGVVLSWCIFNLVIQLFFIRTRGVSLDTYRMVSEGLHSISDQDIVLLITIILDNKLSCVISLAMVIVFGVAVFVRFLNLGNEDVVDSRVNKREKSVQHGVRSEAYVVSYKQQVAFLA